MAFNINEMRNNGLQFGGARPNHFDVDITFPSSIRSLVNQQRDITLKVQAAQIPSSTLGVIQVPFFGRFTKYAGDRTFQPWQVNVLNDEDFKLRNALESWSNSINEMVGNKRKAGIGSDAGDYKTSALVRQYGKKGNILRTYKFEGIFPAQIAEINLEWASNDQIEQFSVVFEYDYWTVEGGTTGTLKGSNVGDFGN
jgi:hypothetical protein